MKTVLAVLLALAVFVPALAQAPAPPAGEKVPLPLRETIARAVEHNFDIAVSRVDPEINRNFITEAEAVFDWSLDGSVDYGKTEEEPSSPLTGSSTKSGHVGAGVSKRTRWGGSFAGSWNYSENTSESSFFVLPRRDQSTLALTYTQSLLRNYGLEVNNTAITTAANNLKISEAALRQRINETIETAEVDYWSLVGAQRQYDVAVASLDLAKDFLRQTKIRVEVGTLPPIEITTAEAEVASREEGVIVAENAVRTAEDTLRALVALTWESPEWGRPIRPTDEPGFAPVAIDVDQAVTTALETRPEIQAAKLAVANAELNERYRNNLVKPDLSVTLGYQNWGNNFDYDFVDTNGDGTVDTRVIAQGRSDAIKEMLTSRDNNSWGVSGAFSIPIGNRAAKSAYARAKLVTLQNNLQLDALRQTVRVQVRQAARDLETAARRVATTRANVVLQRKKLDAEQKRYENGLSTAFQVLTFQTDLRNAESAEINAVVDYNKALAHLGRVKGTLAADRGVTLK